MTIVTASAESSGLLGGTTNSFDSSTLEGIASGTLGSHSSTQFTLSNSQFSLTGQGTGIGYSGGHPSSGTLTSLTFALQNDEPATWSGFSVSVATAWSDISKGDVTAFNNLFFGGDDTFNMQNSLFSNTLLGGSGNDTFNYAGNLDGNTTIDGGTGTDTLNLNGDYGLTWFSGVRNVEIVNLAAGHDYPIGMNATSTLTVNGSALGAANFVSFDSINSTGSILFTAGAGNDTFVSGAGNDTFNGGGGSDTFDCSHATGGVTVNLGLTTAQAIGGGLGSDTLNSVENIIGTQYDDTLTGNASDNFFYALSTNSLGRTTGVDTFNGGAGNDTVALNIPWDTSGGEQGTTIDLRTGSAHIAGTDTFISIEKVIGTELGDTFYGNSDNNIFDAGGTTKAGAYDTIDDSGATGGMVFNMTDYHVGGDTLPTNTITSTGGGEGTDTLYNFTKIVGTNFNDTYYFISPIVPFVDGGGGTDTISFEKATEALGTVSTDQFSQVNTSSETRLILADLSTSVENLTGSPLNDMIMGDENSNVLHGGSGDDAIFGGPGSSTNEGVDALYGDAGNDSLYSGGGGNTNVDNCLFDGGAGDDTLVGSTAGIDTATYQDATGGVTVDLSITTAQAVGGGMGTDTLTSIENLTGSSFNDTLTGDSGNNVLTGANGDDTLDISAGGNDTALGGSGNDTIVAGAALTSADTIDGGAGADTVTLNGDYSAGLTFAATTMVNVETLQLAAGHSYKLTTDDANVAAGQKLTVDASALGAGDVLTFDGSHETDGKFAITGGAGNDVLTGGAGNDTINGGAGNDVFNASAGADTLGGGAGNDTFNLGASLIAADRIDGGAGNDTVNLAGDYSAGVTFGAATMVNVETLNLAAGFNYKLTTVDATVASGATLTVNASALGASNTLTFDGSHDTDGNFNITGGAGNDVLSGGAGNDIFTLTNSGNDVVKGNGGNDTFNFGAAFSASDSVNGGTGSDTVQLSGDYSAGVVFTTATMRNIEQIDLAAGHSYNLTFNNANLSAGQTLTVDATALGASNALTFDASHVAHGDFVLNGGAGNDVLKGGAQSDTILGGGGNDTITGGLGADQITPGSGADVLVYRTAAQSTGVQYDTVTGFDASADKFDMWFTVKAVDATIAHGALSTASFDSDLSAATSALVSHHAVLFTPDSGTLSGHTFLIVDANGTAGYQSGADIVIELSGMTGSLSVTDFI